MSSNCSELIALQLSLTVHYDNRLPKGGNRTQWVVSSSNWRMHCTLQCYVTKNTAHSCSPYCRTIVCTVIGESPASASAYLKLSNGHLLLLGCVH